MPPVYHTVARSEEDLYILTEGGPILPSSSPSEEDSWALSSPPCPPGIFQAFWSQYSFRKVCVKEGVLVFNSIHQCQPLFPLYPNSLVHLPKS